MYVLHMLDLVSAPNVFLINLLALYQKNRDRLGTLSPMSPHIPILDSPRHLY